MRSLSGEVMRHFLEIRPCGHPSKGFHVVVVFNDHELGCVENSHLATRAETEAFLEAYVTELNRAGNAELN